MARRTTITDKNPPDSRSELLNAAAKLFALQGYSATGVQQITDAAGLNKAMLYYYFGSKEQIYDQLIGEGIEGLKRAVTEAMQPNLLIAERIRAFLTGYLTLVIERPWVAQIMYRETVGSGERARKIVSDHFSDSIRQLATLIAAAAEQGTLRHIDPQLSAYTLIGMANIFISSYFLTGRRFELTATVEHIIDLFLYGAACRQVQ